MVIKFWKDKSKKLLEPELFSSIAEDWAKTVKDSSGKDKNNKPTQIRKFYDEVIRFNSIIETNPDEFNNILPYLKMLNAKAAYAVGRKLVSDTFKQFISESLSQIKDKDDFSAFVGLFESFIGYYKFYYEK
jgi:CRISPR-associated protein Csm2